MLYHVVLKPLAYEGINEPVNKSHIVRCHTQRHARILASQAAKAEGKDAWLTEATSTCHELARVGLDSILFSNMEEY
jgi:hypothetical protein